MRSLEATLKIGDLGVYVDSAGITLHNLHALASESVPWDNVDMLSKTLISIYSVQAQFISFPWIQCIVFVG